jgi:hypothetical protein
MKVRQWVRHWARVLRRITPSAGATLGVGLATGLIGMAADAMVEDVNYTMVTDLQISERSKAAVTTDNIALKQGTSGIKLQTSTEQGNRAKYQTRVVSNANKVNLKFEEAKPVLEAQLAKSIAASCNTLRLRRSSQPFSSPLIFNCAHSGQGASVLSVSYQ